MHPMVIYCCDDVTLCFPDALQIPVAFGIADNASTRLATRSLLTAYSRRVDCWAFDEYLVLVWAKIRNQILARLASMEGNKDAVH
jgi:hypothetical protein